MTAPKRIRMTRQHPWRAANPLDIVVSRPTKWGNPHRVGTQVHCSSAGQSWTRRMTPEDAVSFSEVDLRNDLLAFSVADVRAELAGHDLACWCPLRDGFGDPSLGQCPGWCEKPADHDWQDEWPEGPMREHLCTIDQIDRFNAVRVRAGRVREREIALDLDGNKGWDVAGAQRLIDALTEAMDCLQEPVR